MKLSVQEAAAKVGVTRQTLYKMQKAGKISFEQDAKGNHAVDTAELFRCFPPVAPAPDPATIVNTRLEEENRRLQAQLAEFREREQRHLAHIEQLTRLLEHRPVQQTAVQDERNAPIAELTDLVTRLEAIQMPAPRRGFFARWFGWGAA